ncbi:hypothetical protein GYMLUDRAFT_49774 [Collybiopsis luxurians FD-317 M1]|uniref:Uncharacterized protein n=1 Tax=Collybiopsis luxurians FD-317 M1 TaxID=944289 RepID=A0A0D0AQU6_9AGAR|nr:hypothetical protein GYMLUDRAFT_49774 [Collybiopsis luxurians FD-317 M1]
MEDSMPSTSDFVKKLYKLRILSFPILSPYSLFVFRVLCSLSLSPISSGSAYHRVLGLQNARRPILPRRRLMGTPRRLFRRQRHERIHEIDPPENV